VSILCQQGESAEGITVCDLGQRGWTRARRLRNFVWDVQQQIGQYDIVHASLPVPGAQVYQLRSGTLPGQAAARQRMRGVGGRLNPIRRLLTKWEKAVMADDRSVCLAVSEMVADEVRCYYPGKPVRVIYNAVTEPTIDEAARLKMRQALRKELGISAEATVFLLSAMNFALKGGVETIKAFEHYLAANPGADSHLVMLGADLPRKCRPKLERPPLKGRLHSLAPASETERYYALADVCVLLSWYDPCSRVVLEATRREIPSITTRFNGASEILQSGAGRVVDAPKNIEAVAAAMAELSDPKTREACRLACREVSAILRMSRHVDELMEVYQKGINRLC
jgi:UDP-glucose:(heptosyl)LPS alpha-1,3-glucosyltransferase